MSWPTCARRRRVLHSQIEQLRAGRERLAETIGDVRTAVDHITDELFRAEDEARLAAEEAGRQAASGELAELATTADGGSPDDGAGSSPDAVVEGLERRQSVDELFARLHAEAGEPAGPTTHRRSARQGQRRPAPPRPSRRRRRAGGPYRPVRRRGGRLRSRRRTAPRRTPQR